MKFKSLALKNDKHLLTYIDNFNVEDVVMEDYYYCSTFNIFNQTSMYTDAQVGIILNLTDREYADLIVKYHKPDISDAPVIDRDQIEDIQRQISELENKISRSKEYEESSKKVGIYEDELKVVGKELESVDSVQAKYDEVHKEYSQYEHFSKYNLTKVHEDLVKLNSEINELENKLLHSKKVEIHQAITSHTYDTGKIVLAIGWAAGIILFCIVLLSLEIPKPFIYICLGAGLFISLLFLLTSRIPGAPMQSDDENDAEAAIHTIQLRLSELKTTKAQILSLLNIRNTDEFFEIKARMAGLVKSLQYLQEQKDRLLNQMDFMSLSVRKQEIEKELPDLYSKTHLKDALLPSEEYLRLYREIDSLKLKIKDLEQQSDLTKEEILKKLLNIREELKDKLPGFAYLIQSNFVESIDDIKSIMQDLSSRVELPSFEVNPVPEDFQNYSDIQKIVLQYAIAKHVYNDNFVFVIEYLSRLELGDRELVKNIIEAEASDTIRFIIVDK